MKLPLRVVALEHAACYRGAMPVVDYARLPTEQRLARSRSLDQLSTARVLRLMHHEDLRAVRAVGRQLRLIASGISLIEDALRGPHRLWLVGAGTSGRLAVLEAAECPPTFHTSPSQIQALIAGGPQAVFRSREGAEDDRRQVQRAIARRVRRGDVVVGIAASGVTPFVDAALRAAREQGASTILVTCSSGSTIPADVRICVPVGPEVLTGSTRLKAGTATKLVLNMLTLGSMVRLGKTYGHLMVDVAPTSKKLRARALSIIQQVAKVSPSKAQRYLQAAGGNVKVALLLATQPLSVTQARRHITQARGSLRRALESF